MSRSRYVALAWLAFPMVLHGISCSTKAKLVGAGGDCLQATDCEDGLVCVPQKDSGKRLCSNDLTGVQVTEDAAPPPRDAAAQDATADAPPADAPPPEDAPVTDTGGTGDAATE